MKSIRQAGEPNVVETINISGSSSFVITCEHASNYIPISLGNLGLTPAQLATDVVWDIGAADVARGLCKLLGARGILSGYSRLVVDCNRTPGELMSIPAMSQRGFPVPGNQTLTPEEKRAREKEFFWPYQNVIQESVDNYIQAFKRPPIIVSIHSFAPEYHGVPRPWHIGVMWNKDKRIADRVIALLSEDKDILVGDNEPYTAQDEIGFGYAVYTHAESKEYPHVMLEIRSSDIDMPEKAQIWAEKIAGALSKLDIRDIS